MASALTMAGKLDEISEAIGGLRARLDALGDGSHENRRIADDRHKENKSRLDTIDDKIALLASDRRVAIVIVSTVTAGVLWLISNIVPSFISKLWGK